MKMTPLSTHEFDRHKHDAPDASGPVGRADPPNLLSDPDYLRLIACYQNGEFTRCMDRLEKLDKRYPGRQELQKFREDIQLKLSFKTMAVSSKKEKRHKKMKGTLKVTIFAITSTVFVLIVFLFSYYYLNQIAAIRQLEEKTAQLNSLNSQAEQLLLGGQPEAAAEVIGMIEEISPEYENLPELKSQADDLLRLEDEYQSALSLIEEGQYDDALVILQGIESENPGLWDVSQQITSIETIIQIDEYLEEGDAAYQEEDWAGVISAYENALVLDPKLDDSLMIEQLLNSYLNMIINMLQSDEASIEDIMTAESYYRKAVALIPQSKEFASERGNLEEVSSNLLELKYTQTAKAILEDKNQTVNSIADAVDYLEKAVNIDPNNTALQLDLTNAEYYQIAFQYFIEMDWSQAVTNLNQVISVDADYADGNAGLLLFEAYYALGEQYYSSSFYQDALSNLEQAEILAWNDSDNLFRLFQVQVLIGNTYGEMTDYENAVSYYHYTLNAVDALSRLDDYPDIAARYSEAVYLTESGSYTDAFTAYQEVLSDIDVIYTLSEIEIRDGVCLAFFAAENLSTLDAVIEANDLSNNMVVTFGRSLSVPMIEK